ncbi:S41 family peptidase [Williamwhitmania taraxaci]|uniref:Tricorn protease C1 domain-containing protein n=1 Tax=Williamwhitmania taraxaci TaxID=1640674 RepID=A0A1G6RZP5_9BACT|nr:S41 family peptidase [Williamwhitmania taraxaci]SDD09435.1 Tricorn protease C1 domain-containing protein [Williamwhitmania taraxaci]
MSRCFVSRGLLLLSFIFIINSAKGQVASLSKPEKTFEEAWFFVYNNYAFLKEKGINWDKSYSRFRIKVTAKTTDDSLFSFLSQMLTPLNDGHVTLRGNNERKFSANRPSRLVEEFHTPDLRKKVWTMVDSSLAEAGFGPLQYLGREYNGKPLFTYTTNGKIGYMRFTRCFWTMWNMNSFVVNSYLNTIMSTFEGMESVIVDVRFNIGGEDRFSFNVAGRFTDKRILALVKQTRIEGMPAFTYPEERYIKPKGRKPFCGKVVVLTNDRTASAADVFALAMRQLPNVTIVGEPSEGIFSDMYSTRLPNGWHISLSNQRYFSPHMISYEGVGVPVDIVAKNSVVDLESNSDPVLKKALEVLQK